MQVQTQRSSSPQRPLTARQLRNMEGGPLMFRFAEKRKGSRGRKFHCEHEYLTNGQNSDTV